MQEQAIKFAEAASERLLKQGVLVSESSWKASAGVGGKFILKASAEAGVSHENREQDVYNRIYRDIRKVQDELVGKLTRGEISREEFSKQYTSMFQSYASETDRLVKEKGDEKFGASGLVTRPLGLDAVGDALTGNEEKTMRELERIKKMTEEREAERLKKE